MLTRALAGCLIAGLCLIAASEFQSLKSTARPSTDAELLMRAAGESPTRDLGLQSIRILSGLTKPVYVGHAPNDETRLFIIEQFIGTTGRIRIYDLTTSTLLSTPYLSISNVSNASEQGLLGMAFHPDFYNGKPYIYVNYTNSSGTTIIRRYTASSNDPSSNTANSSSGSTVLSIAQDAWNHNGGWLEFGPDGYLWIGMGDGGSSGDPDNDSQDLDSLLGKMLRLDVDSASPYGIPPGNPYNGSNGRQEIWSYGLRNPWRCSFDRETGDLWIADVGQNAWEEINFEPADAPGGINYGWRCYEGDHIFNTSGCDPASSMTFPIYEYSHSVGCSITGGYVYRGKDIPWLNGYYLYGDYCTGETWAFTYDADFDSVTYWQNITSELSPAQNGNYFIGSISSYGEDALGEMYVADLGGEIFKITPGEQPDPTGACCWDISCYHVLESTCDAVQGFYHGDGVSCNVIDCTAPPCPTDCDGSGVIDVGDLLAVIGDWGTTGGCDPDQNGSTNVGDLLQVIGEWGQNCE